MYRPVSVVESLRSVTSKIKKKGKQVVNLLRSNRYCWCSFVCLLFFMNIKPKFFVTLTFLLLKKGGGGTKMTPEKTTTTKQQPKTALFSGPSRSF